MWHPFRDRIEQQLEKAEVGAHIPGTERELILLRTKLEIRSWFLRASLALNIALLVDFLSSHR